MLSVYSPIYNSRKASICVLMWTLFGFDLHKCKPHTQGAFLYLISDCDLKLASSFFVLTWSGKSLRWMSNAMIWHQLDALTLLPVCIATAE